MSDLKRIQFTTIINAPVATVWRLMLGAESYKQWTAAFAERPTFSVRPQAPPDPRPHPQGEER